MNSRKHKRLPLRLLPLLAILLCGYASEHQNPLFNTTWKLHCFRIEQDTAFYRLDSAYTYKHHFKLNETYLNTHNDSLNAVRKASQIFHSTRSMQITFYSDSMFVMTKMRSGGRIYPTELDSGHYVIRNDKVHMSLTTRSDFEMIYTLNRSANVLFIDEPNPLGQQVYCEYTKE
jgi:hypothetical protein